MIRKGDSSEASKRKNETKRYDRRWNTCETENVASHARSPERTHVVRTICVDHLSVKTSVLSPSFTNCLWLIFTSCSPVIAAHASQAFGGQLRPQSSVTKLWRLFWTSFLDFLISSQLPLLCHSTTWIKHLNLVAFFQMVVGVTDVFLGKAAKKNTHFWKCACLKGKIKGMATNGLTLLTQVDP